MKPSSRNSVLLGAALAACVAATNGTAAQAARNVACDGCVGSKDIADGAVKPRDLAPSVLFGEVLVVRANGSPAENCAGLRSALNKAKGASIENMVSIRLEKGTYKCGNTGLKVRPFVVLEGAGRNATILEGNPGSSSDAVVRTASDSHVRSLAVRHKGTGGSTGIAVHVAGRRVTMSDIQVTIDSSTLNTAIGIHSTGGSLALRDAGIRIRSTGQTVGILGESGARLDLMGVWISNPTGTAGSPSGLEVRDSSLRGYGVTIFSQSRGLLARGASTVELTGGTVEGIQATQTFTGTLSCVGVISDNLVLFDTDCSE